MFDEGDGTDNNEHNYESRRNDLEPLPDGPDPTYPQENNKYFRRKKYVRLDKFSLRFMLPNELELPSIMSAFATKWIDKTEMCLVNLTYLLQYLYISA